MNREELKKYKYSQEWINGRIEYLEGYKNTINKLNSIISDMPRGSRKIYDSEAEKLTKLMDSVDSLLDRMVKEQDKQKEILERLDLVEEPYRLILDKVYIQGKTLVTVASEMNYSYVDICRKHGTALEKFDTVI